MAMTLEKPDILVVDDEAYLAEAIGLAVRYEGWRARSAATATAALREVRGEPPDLIVLDVMLPDMDGFELLGRLRSAGHDIPVVMLTARDATEDRVAGLNMGADDYLVKPFSLEELIARISAVLRRGRSQRRQGEPRIVRVRELEVGLNSREVRSAGHLVPLTPTEFELLRYLVINAGTVVSKSQILDHVWHYDFDGNANVVELYVGYLRRKLEAHGPRLIHTVRGFGYVVRTGPGQRDSSHG